MDTKRPFIGGEQLDDPFQFALHGRYGRRTRLEEVLEVGGRPGEVLASAVHAQHIRSRAGLRQGNPPLVVGIFLSRALCEQVVGDTDGQLIVVMQPLDDIVVVGKVLAAATGVDHRRDAKAVHLAHVVARRIDLVLHRQGRPLSERRIEDQRRGLGKELARRLTAFVLLNYSSWRVRSVRRDAERVQRSLVEQRSSVEMQHEDRRIGGGGIDFVERRHAPFCELELRPAADHAHPLRRGRAVCLLPQHAERIGEAGHVLPSHFHVVVEAAADQMCVTVIQAWNDPSSTKVDHFGI